MITYLDKKNVSTYDVIVPVHALPCTDIEID